MFDRIKNIIQQYSGEDVDINDRTNLLTELGLTSFELATISAEIEDEFGINITMEEMYEIKTPEDIISCIQRHTG